MLCRFSAGSQRVLSRFSADSQQMLSSLYCILLAALGTEGFSVLLRLSTIYFFSELSPIIFEGNIFKSKSTMFAIEVTTIFLNMNK